jgi:DNA-binding NtrC family response regulator
MPRRSTQGPDEVMEALKRHDWPGNVRELQNVIERAVIMTTGPVLELQTRGLVTQNVGSAPPGHSRTPSGHISQRRFMKPIGLTAGGVALLPSSDWPGQPSLQ